MNDFLRCYEVFGLKASNGVDDWSEEVMRKSGQWRCSSQGSEFCPRWRNRAIGDGLD
jgi:hypothetical protein